LMCVNRQGSMLCHAFYICTKEYLFKAGRSSFA
jgi:hypothetical protein